ncbi:dicer helicase, partial [Planoprotostelium fungivorum]
MEKEFLDLSEGFCKEKGLETASKVSSQKDLPKLEFTEKLFRFLVNVRSNDLQSDVAALGSVGQIQLFETIPTGSVSGNPYPIFANSDFTMYKLYGESKANYDWFFVLDAADIEKCKRPDKEGVLRSALKEKKIQFFGLKHSWDKDKKPPRSTKKSKEVQSASGEANSAAEQPPREDILPLPDNVIDEEESPQKTADEVINDLLGFVSIENQQGEMDLSAFCSPDGDEGCTDEIVDGFFNPTEPQQLDEMNVSITENSSSSDLHNISASSDMITPAEDERGEENSRKRPRVEELFRRDEYKDEGPLLLSVDKSEVRLTRLEQQMEDLVEKITDMSMDVSQFKIRRAAEDGEDWYLRCEGRLSGSGGLCHARICGADDLCTIYISKKAQKLMVKNESVDGMTMNKGKVYCSKCNTNIGDLRWMITKNISFVGRTNEPWNNNPSSSYSFLEERESKEKETVVKREKTPTFTIRLMKGEEIIEHVVYHRDSTLSFSHLQEALKKLYPDDPDYKKVMWIDEENLVTEQTNISRMIDKSDSKLIVVFHCRRKMMKPHPDQMDMIERSTGVNSIIVSPTGSGKTVIALIRCIEAHKRNPQEFRAVFVVDKVHLATQQAKLFSLYSELKITTITAEDNSAMKWKDCLQFDVVVIIADKFKEMAQQPVIWTDISLLIIDECHHTKKNHPYNIIMKSYRSVPADGKRPVILGMTASPGGAISDSDTYQIIYQLQWNLGKAKIVKAMGDTETKQKERVNEPEIIGVPIEMTKEQKEYKDKVTPSYLSSSHFIQIVLEMNALEKQLGIFGSVNGLEKGSQPYMDELNKDARFEELKKKAEEIAVFHETGEIGGTKIDVQEGKGQPDGMNLKYAQLKSLLESNFETEDTESYRAVVFVTMKRSVKRWHSMLQDHSEIYFDYGYVMGQNTTAGSSSSDEGMTRKVQKENLDKFRKGEFNVLVATNVIEEGLDVPQCNVVFYCADLTSHRSFIQARGRARKEGSKFYVIYVRESPGQSFFERSQTQEESMRRVLEKMCKDSDGQLPDDYDPIENNGGPASPNGKGERGVVVQHLRREKDKKDPVALFKEVCDKHKSVKKFTFKDKKCDDGWAVDAEFLGEKIEGVKAEKKSDAKNRQQKNLNWIDAVKLKSTSSTENKPNHRPNIETHPNATLEAIRGETFENRPRIENVTGKKDPSYVSVMSEGIMLIYPVAMNKEHGRLIQLEDQMEDLVEKMADVSTGDSARLNTTRRPQCEDDRYLCCEGKRAGTGAPCLTRLCNADDLCTILISQKSQKLMLKRQVEGITIKEGKVYCSECNTNIGVEEVYGDLRWMITKNIFFVGRTNEPWNNNPSLRSFPFLEERRSSVKATVVSPIKSLSFFIRYLRGRDIVEQKVYYKDTTLTFGHLKEALREMQSERTDLEYKEVMWVDRVTSVHEGTIISAVLAKSESKLVISFHRRRTMLPHPDQIDMIERSKGVNSIIVSPTGS